MRTAATLSGIAAVRVINSPVSNRQRSIASLIVSTIYLTCASVSVGKRIFQGLVEVWGVDNES